MTRNDITTIWAANELIGTDLETTPIADIVDELVERIWSALEIGDEDEATQGWAWDRAEAIAAALAK